MARDESAYTILVAEFEARHGKVRRRVTRGPKKLKPPKPSAECMFAQAWESTRGPEPARQFRFHDSRKWTVDFAWPKHKLALELEGFGAGGGSGRHHLPAGVIADCEKFNTAVLFGLARAACPVSRRTRRLTVGRARRGGAAGVATSTPAMIAVARRARPVRQTTKTSRSTP